VIAERLVLLAAALVLDAIAGDPGAIWRRVPHPVAIMGAAIGWADRLLNRATWPAAVRRGLGTIAIAAVAGAFGTLGYGLDRFFASIPFGWVGVLLIATVMLAGRSLYDHVRAVADAFSGGLPAARQAVSRIVGRDPHSLDEPRICRAAIESTAENFSDGVVAPALWFAVLGLPGLLAYKAINTADSMIGHLTPRHRDFGWAAARLDDIVNWPAARLSAILIGVAAPLANGTLAHSLRVAWRDAGKHRSVNAGWPEAAMAAALGVSLAGPRRYDGIIVDDPFLNEEGRRDATPLDIGRALRVYVGAGAFLFLLVVLGAAAFAW
jgi:adenosylcobinamide-phosphate synthase